MPRNRIYLGYDRFGLQGAAAVLEARIAEAGGNAREETVAEHADRLRRAQNLQKAKQNFARQPEGYQSAWAEYEALRTSLTNLVSTLKDILPQLRTQIFGGTIFGSLFGVTDGRRLMLMRWKDIYVNTIADAKMIVEFWDGFPRGLPGINVFDEGHKRDSISFTYELVDLDRPSWVREGDKREFTTRNLAEFLLKKFMDFQGAS